MSSQMFIESQESLNHDLFERWIDHAALSIDSTSVYRYMWISIARFADRQDILSMGLSELEDLVIRSTKDKSPAYRRRVAQLITRVTMHSVENHPAKDLPALFPDQRKRPAPAVLVDHQAEQLLKLTDIPIDDWRAVRDVAMVASALGAGIKLHELINMRRSDVLTGMHGMDFKIRGARSRVAPVSQRAVPFIMAWIDVIDRARPASAGDLPLFVGTMSEHGLSERLSKATAYRAFRAMMSKAGIEQGASNRLRHTFGQNQVDNGIKPKVVAEWMGLHQEQTVARYQKGRRPA